MGVTFPDRRARCQYRPAPLRALVPAGAETSLAGGAGDDL